MESETNFFASILLKGGILEFRILIFGKFPVRITFSIEIKITKITAK